MVQKLNIKNVVENNMKKEEEEDLTIADILLSIKALEELLISKNVITLEEYNSMKEKIVENISKVILEKSIITDN